MPVNALTRAESYPYHISCNMHPTSQQDWPESTGNQNTDEVIDWVEVLCADAYSVHEVVMDLVEIRVEQPVVHESVEEIEGYIFSDHQKDQLKEKSCGIR